MRPARLIILLALAGSLAACATQPTESPLPQTAVTHTPEVVVDPVTSIHTMEIDVLIYNIEGLPWPIRKHRSEALQKIGKALGEMRRVGTEPDIVLIQEGFISAIEDLIDASGYPNWLHGSGTANSKPNFSPDADESFRDEWHPFKGERLLKLGNDGLYILSNFPIIEKYVEPFYPYECAGFDCLANKGILGAEIGVPGLPERLEVFTTHMNARKASGVSAERSLYAHHLQVDDLEEYINRYRDTQKPLVFGGDFNMRSARERLLHASSKIPYGVASYYCTRVAADCKIDKAFRSDEPWLDTQDLQGFDPADQINVRPVAIGELFAEPVFRGKPMADHDGYIVRWRFSWKPADFADASE